MGFWTEYFSTLLKGLGPTVFKERIEARRVINSLRSADHILYKSIFEDVEKKHRVTKAIKEEKKIIEKLKKAAENAYSLIFNLSTEEIQLLKDIEKILKGLEDFSKSIGSDQRLKKVERDFAIAIYEALKKAESEDREEFKYVMVIIKEAEEEDKNKFLANVRLAFQKEKAQTLLAKFAARAEIRMAKRDILKLEKIPAKIKKIKDNLTKKGRKYDVDKALGDLYEIIKEVKVYANDAFKEIFLIAKRDMFLMLKILLDLNTLREFNLEWIGKHNMPKDPIDKKNREINKIEVKIAKDFHTIAQAFRIIIAKTQELENEAERDAS